MDSKVLTIVFTDIKGFTERTANADREFALKLRHTHDQLLTPLIRQYQGTLIKTIGDAFLLTFESPTNAVLCALVMQETLRHHNQTATDAEKIEIRVAINTGEVNVTPTDILGEPVNVASRVEGITEANEIWFTEATYLAMNKQEAPTSVVGEFRLKGIPEPVKVYRVIQDPQSAEFKKTLATQQARLAVLNAAPAAASSLPLFVQIVLAGVILALLAGGAYWAHQVSTTNQLLDTAQQHIEKSQFEEALSHLQKALAINVANPRARGMAVSAVNGRLDELVRRGEPGKAHEFLESHRSTYPIADEYPTFRTRIRVAEAQDLLSKGKKDQAQTMVDTLLQEYPANRATLLEVARFYDGCGINWTKTVRHYHALAVLDPATMLADKGYLENMDYFLRQVPPTEGYDDVRAFIAAHVFDRFRPALEESLQKPASSTRSLRQNAFALLSAKGLAPATFSFQLTNLLDPEPSSPSALNKHTLDFFLERRASGFSAAEQALVPASISAFPLFDYRLATDAPAIILGGTLFFPALQEYLRATAVDPTHHERRFNAFAALTVAQAASDELTLTHHAVTILEWHKGKLHSSYVPDLFQAATAWKHLAPKVLGTALPATGTSGLLPATTIAPADVKAALLAIAEAEQKKAQDFESRGLPYPAKTCTDVSQTTRAAYEAW